MKYKLNSIFGSDFKDFTFNIKSYFSLSEQSIHKARNELKVIDYKETRTVVKSFKTPHFLNQIVYSFLRDSKAKKSYNYSLKIKDFTPRAISYIEFYENSLLKESYFISEKFDYNFTIREPLLDKKFPNREAIFKAFAKFSLELHTSHIFHEDYSPGNILIKQEGVTFVFKIVDINRMTFKTLSLDERLKNFNKLWANDEDLAIILKEYAKIANENITYCIQKAQAFNRHNKNMKNMKKWLKGKKVVD